MERIVSNINWRRIRDWNEICEGVILSLKHSEILNSPNLHYCVADLISLFKFLTPKTENHTSSSIRRFCQFLILGLCYKCLRCLTVIHFAAFLFAPCYGYDPDLNKYIPIFVLKKSFNKKT